MNPNPLTPGPEADALVAEAMGWTNVRESKHPECLGRFIGHDVSGNIGFVPAYTTSWAGLGEMVDWMVAKPREWNITVSTYPRSTEPPAWCHIAGDGTRGDANADTPMLAVAEALLAAVEGEKTRG